MSHVAAYSAGAFDHASLTDTLMGICRRWFAIETVYNPHALEEIGLGSFGDR